MLANGKILRFRRSAIEFQQPQGQLSALLTTQRGKFIENLMKCDHVWSLIGVLDRVNPAESGFGRPIKGDAGRNHLRRLI